MSAPVVFRYHLQQNHTEVIRVTPDYFNLSPDQKIDVLTKLNNWVNDEMGKIIKPVGES